MRLSKIDEIIPKVAEWLPPGKSGDVRIGRIDITAADAFLASMRPTIYGPGRGATRPGEYTGLWRAGKIWMSDTDDERTDHTRAVIEMRRRGGRVLVNGLGLGMVIAAALELPNVRHVDVIERDPDVVALVHPALEKRYDPARLTVHILDAYEAVPTGYWNDSDRWTVAWHDIWPRIERTNLPDMDRLEDMYADRVDWQDSWSRRLCEAAP
jgi:hypothetical protein